MTSSKKQDENLYRFGPFCLDAGERVLLRDGRLVPLSPKAVSTLLVLVQSMGHVVEKDVLMAKVWPDEVVEEGNLAQHVFRLRRVLGDSPNYIETVPRRGYRFMEPTNGAHHSSKYYMENAEAYQAYLNARDSWSQHTTNGLKEAIRYFWQALDLEPDSALAYAGIVDCYLRLATNYLPPASASAAAIRVRKTSNMVSDTKSHIKIRSNWDREIANRECRRADELKLHYPTIKQWRAAYHLALQLYNQTLMKAEATLSSVTIAPQSAFVDLTHPRIQFESLTPDEDVQISCVIARDQIDTGNYNAACAVLKRWWTMGEWPKLNGLNSPVSADLLLTVGRLAGFMSSAMQVPGGQKHAEALLNGAIGLFEQLGFSTLSAEGRIELALCYEREGMLDLARTMLLPALKMLPSASAEIRRSALVKLANVEWRAGRLHVALEQLHEAENVEASSPVHGGDYHMLLAAITQTLPTPETRNEEVDTALQHCLKGINQWEAVGNHRRVAVGENNYGYLLVTLGRHDEARIHMVRSRDLFNALGDKRRCAQVDDSIAHLHLAEGRFELAEQASGQAVKTLEMGLDPDLAESLTTQGLVLCKLGRYREARRVLDRAYQVARRCGDNEGACVALLTVFENMSPHLGEEETIELIAQLDGFLVTAQKATTVERINKCRDL